MKLYFVRHTSAVNSLSNDAQRTLTQHGEDEARRVGITLAGAGVRPARVFSSPLVRAQQTAGILARGVQFDGRVETLRELANGQTTPALLNALPAGADEIVLVGHMPSLAEHVAAILLATDSGQFVFGKGSIACIEAATADTSAAKILWFKHL